MTKTEIDKRITDLQETVQGTSQAELIGSFFINGVVLEDLDLSRLLDAKKRLIHELNDIIAEEIYRLQVYRETGEDRIPRRDQVMIPDYLLNENFKISQR